MSDALGFKITETTVEPWRKVLSDAADYIDAHGWCPEGTGEAGYGDNGEVCPVVAMVRVCHNDNLRREAYVEIFHRTGLDTVALNRRCTSAAEVCDALRSCARS